MTTDRRTTLDSSATCATRACRSDARPVARASCVLTPLVAVACWRFIFFFILTALFVAASFIASGCSSRTSNESDAAGVIVVNAPAAGEVRRVLVGEGTHVSEGAVIVEIAVRDERAAAPQPSEDPQARAARGVTAAQGEIEAARAEMVRTEVEVERLTPLVASGQATQGELDGARARYYQAQQRFQHAQESAQSAQSGLIAARQPQAATQNAPAEHIVAARATSAGVVSVLNARIGAHVTAGQPLATLRADSR